MTHGTKKQFRELLERAKEKEHPSTYELLKLLFDELVFLDEQVEDIQLEYPMGE